MKKKTIRALLLAALMLLPSAMMAEVQQFLVLTQGDGSVSKFALSESPVVSFDGDMLVVTCGEQSISASLLGLSYSFTEEEGEATAIHSPLTSNPSPLTSRIAFGEAQFTGLKAGAQVVVYDLNGRAIASEKASSDGKASISLSQMPQGVYIIKAQGKAIKVKI